MVTRKRDRSKRSGWAELAERQAKANKAHRVRRLVIWALLLALLGVACVLAPSQVAVIIEAVLTHMEP